MRRAAAVTASGLMIGLGGVACAVEQPYPYTVTPIGDRESFAGEITKLITPKTILPPDPARSARIKDEIIDPVVTQTERKLVYTKGSTTLTIYIPQGVEPPPQETIDRMWSVIQDKTTGILIGNNFKPPRGVRIFMADYGNQISMTLALPMNQGEIFAYVNTNNYDAHHNDPLWTELCNTLTVEGTNLLMRQLMDRECNSIGIGVWAVKSGLSYEQYTEEAKQPRTLHGKPVEPILLTKGEYQKLREIFPVVPNSTPLKLSPDNLDDRQSIIAYAAVKSMTGEKLLVNLDAQREVRVKAISEYLKLIYDTRIDKPGVDSTREAKIAAAMTYASLAAQSGAMI